MWQLFALGAIIFSAFESVIDKIIIVQDKSINLIGATFIRNVAYLLLALIVGLSGIFGRLEIIVTWPIVFVAITGLMSGFFYTYFLKNIEISGYKVFSSLFPISFLIVDLFILNSSISTSQVLGIASLIIGGSLFVLIPKSFRLKTEYTLNTFVILLLSFLSGGAQYYLFKYYIAPAGINEISFICSSWVLVIVGYLIIITIKNSWKTIVLTAKNNNYLAKVFISKGSDLAGALLLFHAILLTDISKVRAFGSLSPLILLFMIFVLQHHLKFKADENLQTDSFYQKFFGALLLVLGIWLVS